MGSIEAIDTLGTAFFTLLPGVVVAFVTYLFERRHPFYSKGSFFAIIFGTISFFTPGVGFFAKISTFLIYTSVVYWIVEKVTRKKRGS